MAKNTAASLHASVMPLNLAYFYKLICIFTFVHLAEAFIQSDLQMRAIEAIKLTVRQQTYVL